MIRGKYFIMRLKQCFVGIALLFIFSMTQAMAQKHVVGKASYYGSKFHGRLTSDGSVYHRDSLTCAHRTLPFWHTLEGT
ncbi:rare lipoprotein A double-psi beta [gut metagenome]|uniref:Rare lipoprotein A double-psi beta n=1 Tax=gut metagenome TaxID=749906 RepID=J9FWF9_9ZZZZ